MIRPAVITYDPQNLPGVCFRCRTGPQSREYFFDIGVDTEFEGTIYICKDCFQECIGLTDDFLTKLAAVDFFRLANSALEEAKELEDKYNAVFKTLESIGISIEGIKVDGPGISEVNDIEPVRDERQVNEDDRISELQLGFSLEL